MVVKAYKISKKIISKFNPSNCLKLNQTIGVKNKKLSVKMNSDRKKKSIAFKRTSIPYKPEAIYTKANLMMLGMQMEKECAYILMNLFMRVNFMMAERMEMAFYN